MIELQKNWLLDIMSLCCRLMAVIFVPGYVDYITGSYINGNGLRKAKIGMKTYKSNKDLSQLLDDLIAHTTPDVAW